MPNYFLQSSYYHDGLQYLQKSCSLATIHLNMMKLEGDG